MSTIYLFGQVAISTISSTAATGRHAFFKVAFGKFSTFSTCGTPFRAYHRQILQGTLFFSITDSRKIGGMQNAIGRWRDLRNTWMNTHNSQKTFFFNIRVWKIVQSPAIVARIAIFRSSVKQKSININYRALIISGAVYWRPANSWYCNIKKTIKRGLLRSCFGYLLILQHFLSLFR